jgi:hypothetical protein
MKNPEILLLKACLLEPEQAFEAYRHWKQQTDFEQLSPASFSLLPKLFKHLEQLLHDDLTPRLRGIYKQAWLQQQHRIAQEQQLLEFLQQHNIQFEIVSQASRSLLSSTDLHIAKMLELLPRLPQVWLKHHKNYYWWQWQTRGQMRFSSVRVLKQIQPQRWLNRLLLADDDLGYLAQNLGELQNIKDWQLSFDQAAKHGLCKRLYHLLQLAQEANLLEPRELPSQFSSFDQTEYLRSKSISRWLRWYYTLQLQLVRKP